jgi:hypothetical protein
MGIGTRLAGAEFAFLARLCAAGGTPHGERLFLHNSHSDIMSVYGAIRWSILTSTIGPIGAAVRDEPTEPLGALNGMFTRRETGAVRCFSKSSRG